MKATAQFLFRNIRITDPRSPLNGQVIDLEIEDGKVSKAGHQLNSTAEVQIDGTGFCAAPGIFDMQVQCGEPGDEEKETFESLENGALAGGVTGLLLMPSTHPVIDKRTQVEYVLRNTEKLSVKMYPAGALSNDLKGAQLAELADMHAAGAIAFTDDKSPVSNSVLVHLAMQYNKVAGGVLLFHAEDATMSLGGKVNEGLFSVQLGMKGAPSISEELGVVRLLTLARYHQCRIHIHGVSTVASIELIRKAKADGLLVTCSTYPHLLFFSDEALMDFDSRFKVWPPLRSEADRQALLAAVEDGTIDVISSDHRPQTIEHKEVEFDYAAFGTIGVETAWPACFTAFSGKNVEALIERFCYAPREILGCDVHPIKEGEVADFFLYQPDESFTYTTKDIKSRSANSAFIQQSLKGKIVGTFTASNWFPA